MHAQKSMRQKLKGQYFYPNQIQFLNSRIHIEFMPDGFIIADEINASRSVPSNHTSEAKYN